MSNTLASKTVQVALMFAGIGVGLILFDTAIGYTLKQPVRYVPELFALLGGMFTALAAKNGADNYFAYAERRTVMQTGTILGGSAGQAPEQGDLPPMPPHPRTSPAGQGALP